MTTEETWLPVLDWVGIYEVSDLGRVRRVLVGKGTRGPNWVLRQGAEKGGYLHVTLLHAGKRAVVKVHKLVLQAFVGTARKGTEINHKDGDPKNNRLDNLEYCSSSQNKLHAYRTLGRSKVSCKGASNGRSKLSDMQVSEIRQRYSDGGVSQQTLADEFGVNQTLISFIVRRVNWRHIS